MKKILLKLIAVICAVIICSTLLPDVGISAAIIYPEEEGQEQTDTENAAQPEELNLHATSALLMDADSGRVLYEKNGYEVMPMASTTKIMTCIIALENGNLESEVIVSANAARQPKVHLGMREDEKYILKDLIYSLMLESHNDSAVAIAEHIGGSVEGFAELMNQKARDIGAHNTNFVTPNGLDAEGHQTTAAELAAITRYAIQNEEFREIIITPDYAFSTTDGSRSHTVNNKDGFLSRMEGAFGVKTGFTGKAGYCFVGALERDGRTYISVVLACGWPPDKTWKWEDTKKLMNYGLDYYYYQELFAEAESFEILTVEQGQEESVDTYIEGALEMMVSDWDQVDVSYDYEKKLKAPVEKDQTVGFAVISLNGESVEKYPIKTKNKVEIKDYDYWWDKVMDGFVL